jgi:2,4-dienoyl-CoA reductase-like NADH-dependent reductase (Old Yellow Enzyme family)
MTEDGLAIYRALAAGGAGLIITGQIAAMPGGRDNDVQTCIYEDRFIPSVRRIAETVHAAGNGCKIVAQINHTAVQGRMADPIAPSAKPFPAWRKQPRAMTTAEVEELTAHFAQAVRRARDAGFDGAEIHAAHGFVLHAFLSPYTNTRTDRYGGSLENRVRVLAEIIAQARKLVGPDFPILARVHCDDGVAGGTNIETFPALAAEVEKAGVDALDVTGSGATRRPDNGSFFLPHVQNLRVKVPVILTGGNRNIDRLETILKTGTPQFIGMARPFIREPDLPNRWRDRRGSPSAACISCGRCLEGFRQGLLTRCRVQPDASS